MSFASSASLRSRILVAAVIVPLIVSAPRIVLGGA